MTPTQTTADIAVATSAGLAAVTWVADLGIILQLFATTMAILAGLAAAWWQAEKAIAARRERINNTCQACDLPIKHL